MKCVKIVLGIAIILGIFSCGKDQAQVEEEHLNYTFHKEGTLTFKDANGTPLQTIDLEIAENQQETAKGLMNRDSMAENQGMIFIFETPTKQTFYMKNTRIPLDLVYVSADSTVVDIQQGKPYNETTIPSDTISQYVIELNKGMAAKWGIKENQTKVSWTRQ